MIINSIIPSSGSGSSVDACAVGSAKEAQEGDKVLLNDSDFYSGNITATPNTVAVNGSPGSFAPSFATRNELHLATYHPLLVKGTWNGSGYDITSSFQEYPGAWINTSDDLCLGVAHSTSWYLSKYVNGAFVSLETGTQFDMNCYYLDGFCFNNSALFYYDGSTLHDITANSGYWGGDLYANFCMVKHNNKTYLVSFNTWDSDTNKVYEYNFETNKITQTDIVASGGFNTLSKVTKALDKEGNYIFFAGYVCSVTKIDSQFTCTTLFSIPGWSEDYYVETYPQEGGEPARLVMYSNLISTFIPKEFKILDGVLVSQRDLFEEDPSLPYVSTFAADMTNQTYAGLFSSAPNGVYTATVKCVNKSSQEVPYTLFANSVSPNNFTSDTLTGFVKEVKEDPFGNTILNVETTLDPQSPTPVQPDEWGLNPTVEPGVLLFLWERPDLTSATSYGVVSDSRGDGNQTGWQALDGNLFTNFVPDTAAGWWKWELPHEVRFVQGESSITWVHMNNSEAISGSDTLQFFADEDCTVPLTNAFQDPSSPNITVDLPVLSTVDTTIIYLNIKAHSGFGGASEIKFNNVYVEGSSGSVTVSKGYYKSGQNTLLLPENTKKTLTQLKEQNPVGYKNNVLLTLDSEQVTDFILCGDGVQPEGSFVDTATLPINVYVNKGKEIILGTEPQSGLKTSLGLGAENFSIVGSLTSEDGVFSGFSTSNYINFNNAGLVDLGSNTWEIKTKFKPMYSGSTEEEIIRAGTGIMIRTQSNAWKLILQNQSGSLFVNTRGGSFVTGTWYWLKASYDGTTYKLEVSTDGLVYDTVIQQASTDTAYSSALFNYIGYDGGALYVLNGGSIDLKETSFTIGSTLFWSPYGKGSSLNTTAGYDYISESMGLYELNSTLKQSLDDLVPEVSDRSKTMDVYYVLTQQGDTNVKLLSSAPVGVGAYKKTYVATLTDDLTDFESIEEAQAE